MYFSSRSQPYAFRMCQAYGAIRHRFSWARPRAGLRLFHQREYRDYERRRSAIWPGSRLYTNSLPASRWREDASDTWRRCGSEMGVVKRPENVDDDPSSFVAHQAQAMSLETSRMVILYVRVHSN